MKTKQNILSTIFCDKCHSIMVPTKKGKNIYLKCRKCGAEKRKDIKDIKIVEERKKIKGVTILEKDETPLPITDRVCPKCDNPKAYWWLQQTRSADEPPTQFFRCTKCKYTWREYK
ncbi:MAG: transcription factor S [Candidatus Aenigmatarchaeota archaeon]